ncbi:MAG: hypothetical protein ACR2NW_07110 [Thermodesulfobacteriota bacterium]
MVLRSFILLLSIITIPLVAFGESPTNEKTIKQIKPEPAVQNAHMIPAGTYKNQEGQEIVIKESIINGGEINDLSKRGIIITSGKVEDSSKRGIIIVESKDGIYTGPGGESFTVKNGIIIIDN